MLKIRARGRSSGLPNLEIQDWSFSPFNTRGRTSIHPSVYVSSSLPIIRLSTHPLTHPLFLYLSLLLFIHQYIIPSLLTYLPIHSPIYPPINPLTHLPTQLADCTFSVSGTTNSIIGDSNMVPILKEFPKSNGRNTLLSN